MWTLNSDAITDLRRILSDNDTDKLCDMKFVIGKINGVNQRFKTFERRRITDFSAAIVSPSPVGVYLNNVRLTPATDILTDDLTSGSFELVVPPVDGDELRATYYYRWFLDPEMDQFLKNASQWLGLGENYVNIPPGLQPAALHYAAQEAYDRLAMQFSTKISNTFMFEDAPDAANKGVIDSFNNMSKKFHDKAKDLRDNYYTRQGQSLAPLFRSVAGAVRDPMPKR